MVKGIIGTKATEFVRPIIHLFFDPLSSEVMEAVTPAWLRSWRRQKIFQKIYARKLWGQGTENETFFSGPGSRGEVAHAYVTKISDELERIAREAGRNISVVDLGCGDFSIGRALLEHAPHISYIGCDIVADLITLHAKQHTGSRVQFQQIDIVADPLPRGDVCLIRQVLQHLSNDDVKQVLAKLEQYRVVFVSEGQPRIIKGPVNPDKPVGSGVRFDYLTGIGRGLELDQPPFGLATREILRAAAGNEDVSTVEIKHGIAIWR
jgi:SAM-dependent methyltransferase